MSVHFLVLSSLSAKNKNKRTNTSLLLWNKSKGGIQSVFPEFKDVTQEDADAPFTRIGKIT